MLGSQSAWLYEDGAMKSKSEAGVLSAASKHAVWRRCKTVATRSRPGSQPSVKRVFTQPEPSFVPACFVHAAAFL